MLIDAHLQEIAYTFKSDINVARNFELSLQVLNDAIAEFASQVRIPIEDFHSVVGFIDSEQVFVSGIGKLQTNFMHQTAKQRYTIYELEKQFPAEVSWKRPFVTILDGELNAGDIFYIAPPLASREISDNDLQDILVTLPPSSALKRIEQYLGTHTSFSAVCFSVSDLDEHKGMKKSNPLASINELSKTKEKTSNLLSEQGLNIRASLTNIFSPLLSTLSTAGSTGPSSTFKRILRMIIHSLIRVIATVSFSAIMLYRAARTVFTRINEIYKASTKEASLLEIIGNKANAVLSFLRGTSKRSRILSAITVCTIFLLIFGVQASSKSRAKLTEIASVDIIFDRVEEKIDAADASLIYQDSDQAELLLAEALALLQSLANSDDETLARLDDYRSRISDVSLSIKGLSEVELNEIGSLPIEELGSFRSLERSSGSLIAITDTGNAYRLNDNITQLEVTKGTVASLQFSAAEGSEFLLVDVAKQLARYNETTQTIQPIVSGTNDMSSVEDLSLYNGNLYVLNGDQGQIVKMRPRVDGFEAGTLWITSGSSEVRGARSLTIDSDIFILTQDDILRFSAGSEVSWNLAGIDPPLNDGIQIWTDLESSYLYILEPTNERIIVFNKDGSFIAQYANPAFGGARSFSIDEVSARITVVTDRSAYQFTPAHLLP
jgi:hypothetical protein